MDRRNHSVKSTWSEASWSMWYLGQRILDCDPPLANLERLSNTREQKAGLLVGEDIQHRNRQRVRRVQGHFDEGSRTATEIQRHQDCPGTPSIAWAHHRHVMVCLPTLDTALDLPHDVLTERERERGASPGHQTHGGTCEMADQVVGRHRDRPARRVEPKSFRQSPYARDDDLPSAQQSRLGGHQWGAGLRLTSTGTCRYFPAA